MPTGMEHQTRKFTNGNKNGTCMGMIIKSRPCKRSRSKERERTKCEINNESSTRADLIDIVVIIGVWLEGNVLELE